MSQDEKPEMENRPIPLWIKVMWLVGISWIIGYILMGLKHLPHTW